MKNKCKKRFVAVLSVIAAVIIFLSIAGPQLVLMAARQPESETGFAYSEYFLNSYDDIRLNLKERVNKLRNSGITVETSEYAVDESDNLYVDNIYIPSVKEKTNLIVLTTGVHGMEGYIGSVMLDVFFEDIYPGLDTEKTGVLIVANVNPYGMKYMRRYNENNVDLNRNFIIDWEKFDLSSNKDYPEVKEFLQPEGKIKNAFWHEAGFYLNLAKEALTKGADKVSDALLTGQYEYPNGVYYGGNGDEKSTSYLKNVFNTCLDGEYENIVHIDIHSGYGPRYNMVIFNSVYETMTEAETKEAFDYEYVISHDSESFYATTGDTTDYFYRLAESKNTDKALFSTCFEFGTIGDSFVDSILSLKYTVDENRQHWYPSDSKVASEVVRENYNELFYPTETQWREKTVEDFKTATTGVLNAKLK
ncbi:MAG: DUF2817 domain-containing protein [Clostridia bacterium]|nr:DUF2817 domain-containing protein [Clostridia bacterium]